MTTALAVSYLFFAVCFFIVLREKYKGALGVAVMSILWPATLTIVLLDDLL